LRSQGQLRILLVEDEWIIALRLEEVVREMGFEPAGPVPTVRQALALINDESIGAAILDVNLGSGEKSFPIAEALKNKSIPFLFVSGYQERDLPAEFAGVVICPKPYTEDTLRRALVTLGFEPRALNA
jgi:DNA-binding response OmpR family regulator